MATLAEYHAAMGRRIAEFAGTLEHFAGDGFMVFFNDPVEQPDHAERAVHMALAMRADVERPARPSGGARATRSTSASASTPATRPAASSATRGGATTA